MVDADKSTNDSLIQREECARNCNFAKMAVNSVPRWAFLSALGMSALIGLSFGGWHAASLKTLKAQLDITIAGHRKVTETRIADANDKYTQDVERFIRAVGENRKAIHEVGDDVNKIKINLAKIKVTQDVVVKKLDIR
jgi:hypothetical protein